MTESGLRRSCVWLVAVPLMLAGSQAAHALAYRLAYPSLSVRVNALAMSGHGYLGRLPLAFGLLGAVVVCSLVWVMVDSVRGGTPRPIPPVAFAVLPPLAFTLQEFVERWIAVGGLPWWMVEQPTFRIGLLLQLPFGLVTFVVSRLLLRGTHELGRRLAESRSRSLPAWGSPRLSRPSHDVLAPARPRACWSTRGPPLVGW